MRLRHFLALLFLVGALALPYFPTGRGPQVSFSPQALPIYRPSEGPCQAVTIEVGPFDIHRRYRSMEGPWAEIKISFAELLAARKTTLGEDRVNFVEGGKPATMGGPRSPQAASVKVSGTHS